MVPAPGEETEEAAVRGAGGFLRRIAVLTLTALVAGGAASLAAIAFIEAVDRLDDLLLISPKARVQFETAGALLLAATVAVPTAGGLLVGLLLARGTSAGRAVGPPDVIGAVQLGRPLPGPRAGGVSTLAAAVSLGAGASVGQYGPMVALGAMLGEAAGGLARRLRQEVPHLGPIATASGVAAAIATAFNAPIAGLVFAHEVVLRHSSTQSFAPTTVAATLGYVLAAVVFDRPPLFLVEFAGVRHSYEFALFGVVGLLAAGLAVLFMTLVLRAQRLAAASRLPPALRPAAAGLAVGLTALWLPDVLGIGAETLRFATIEGAFAVWELVALVLAKTLLTALCLGFGFAGGAFSPALLIGALFGALSWTAIAATGLPVSEVAVYALAGMMAVTSPVIGAPLTTIVIVFELTRNYDITTAAMVAVALSNLVAHHSFGRSLFDVQLARAGVDLSAGRDRARLDALRVADLATRDFVAARTDEPLAAARDRLRASDWLVAFVTDAEGRYRGRLREPDAVAADPDAPLAGLLRPGGLVFDETTTVLEAMHRLEGFVGDAVPVVSAADGRLIGVVTEAALVGAYLRVSEDLREEENAPI